MEKVCEEKFAYASFDNDFLKRDVKCKIYQVQQPITVLSTSMLMTKNNPFTKVFNHK